MTEVLDSRSASLFVSNALAINVVASQIGHAATDLLNAGWTVVETRRTPHRVSFTTIVAIPPQSADQSACDLVRRKLEYHYGRLAA